MKPETPKPRRKPSLWAIVQKYGAPCAYQLAALLDRLINPLSLRRKKYALVMGACLPVFYCIVLIKSGWEKQPAAALPVQRLSVPQMQHDKPTVPRFKSMPDKGYYDSLYQALKANERKSATLLWDTAYPLADQPHLSSQKIRK